MSKPGYIYVHPLAFAKEIDEALVKYQAGIGIDPLTDVQGNVIPCHLCGEPATTYLAAYTDDRQGFVCKWHFNYPYAERPANRLIEGQVRVGNTQEGGDA